MDDNNNHYNSDDEVLDKEHLLSTEDEQLSHIDRNHAQQTPTSSNVTQRLLGGALVLFLACTGLLFVLYRGAHVEADTPRVLTPVPSIPQHMVTFQQDDRFAGPSNQENDQAWNMLMPAGDGFINVKDRSHYNLPPGKNSKNGDVYDISLFHQLHCLSSIRSHMILLRGSIGRNNSQEIQEILLDPQVPHMYHCFDYIRQGLMCAGDMTVEWPRVEPDGRRFAFDGWGVPHLCKNWDAIMTFMNKNDVANSL